MGAQEDCYFNRLNKDYLHSPGILDPESSPHSLDLCKTVSWRLCSLLLQMGRDEGGKVGFPSKMTLCPSSAISAPAFFPALYRLQGW